MNDSWGWQFVMLLVKKNMLNNMYCWLWTWYLLYKYLFRESLRKLIMATWMRFVSFPEPHLQSQTLFFQKVIGKILTWDNEQKYKIFFQFHQWYNSCIIDKWHYLVFVFLPNHTLNKLLPSNDVPYRLHHCQIIIFCSICCHSNPHSWRRNRYENETK